MNISNPEVGKFEMNISNPWGGKFEMNIPNPEVAQNPDAWRMFVTMRLLGLRTGETWSPWRKAWYTGPPWIKRRYLISLKKRMIYSTSLEKWWYTGPSWYLVSLGKRMIYFTSLEKWWYTGPPWGKTGDTWSPWGKGWYTLSPWKNDDILAPLGGKQEIPGLLGEKMLYWTPLEKRKGLTSLVQRRKYWISFWGTHQWFYFILLFYFNLFFTSSIFFRFYLFF